MSTTVALTIAGCTAATAAIKSIGPIVLGGRELPTWFTSVVILLSPALLAALVATQVFAEGDRLALEADTGGVAAGGLVYWRTESIVACVAIAAAVTAALRALGG